LRRAGFLRLIPVGLHGVKMPNKSQHEASVQRRHREAMIAAYRRSGLTQRAFAQREGIGFYRFVAWLKRDRQQRGKHDFVEVNGPRRLAAPGNLEVALPSGVVVRGADVEQIAVLVERLGRC
jgi:hypothetical protein